MVFQIITPQQETIELKVSLLANYVGKKVHCLFYVEDEAEIVNISKTTAKKPSDFFGILSPEEGDRFEKHVKKIRNEWR